MTDVRWEFLRLRFDHGVDLQLATVSVIGGALAALLVGFLVRRAYFADLLWKRRFARLLLPVAIAVFLVMGEAMRREVVYRLGHLAQHRLWLNLYEDDWRALGISAAYAGVLREHHIAMKKKWEYLVWHPWISADPDPPEPKRDRGPTVR
jgi:hypothetical protein